MKVHQFSSYAAYLTAACGPSEMFAERSSRNGGSSFTGTHSFDEAVGLARAGWTDGAEKVKAIAATIRDRLLGSLTERASATWDVAGADVDVGRFVVGEPECMIDFVPEVVNAPAKFLRVTVNMSASGGVSCDEFIRRGAAAVALIDCLEEQGYRVEVDAVESCTGIGGAAYATVIRLKEASEPVEIDRLAFVLAHPSSLRRIQFSYMETWPAADRIVWSVPGGYGRPANIPEDLAGDINIQQMLFGSESAAAAWVLGRLREQGIEIAG